jgi:hypothetical protein
MWIDTYAPDGADSDKVTLNIYFHATPAASSDARLDPNEVAEIGWFASNELPSDLAFPGHVPEVLGAWTRAVSGASPSAASPVHETAAPGLGEA